MHKYQHFVSLQFHKPPSHIVELKSWSHVGPTKDIPCSMKIKQDVVTKLTTARLLHWIIIIIIIIIIHHSHQVYRYICPILAQVKHFVAV